MPVDPAFIESVVRAGEARVANVIEILLHLQQAMAAHIPPADAPEKTSSETSCRGTIFAALLSRFPLIQGLDQKIENSRCVYAPAEIALAMLMPILKAAIDPFTIRHARSRSERLAGGLLLPVGSDVPW